MSDLVPAPWNVYENDPTDRKFMLVFNGYNRKTFRFPKRKVGSPLGATADEKWTRFLVAEMLLVKPEEIDRRIEEKLRHLTEGFPGNAASAVLMPTYACQLGCVYCFNEGLRADDSKKRLPAPKLAKKLLDYFDDTPAQFWTLRVTGGGEPLMATDYLAEVSTYLQEAAWERGRDYSMAIISNAQMATKKRVAKLMKAGLVSIFTTLDPNHDQSRPLKNGKPTFDTIVENILAFPPELKVKVNINTYLGDKKGFMELVERMEPIRHRVAEVRTTLVYEAIEPGKALLNAAPKGYSRRFGKKEMDYSIWAAETLTAHGFRVKSVIPYIGCESYMAAENLALNFAGESSFCGGLDNMDQYMIDPNSEADRKKFDLRNASPQWKSFCKKDGAWCPYLMSCWGGCRMTSVTAGLDWSVINCEYEFFDASTRYQLRHWSA